MSTPDLFQSLPVVGILRHVPAAALGGLIPAAIAGGVTHLEITLDTPDAADRIRHAASLASGRARIGAGTVTTRRRLDQALDAGAAFIVTPALHPDVVRACVDAGIPVFPGALSPDEVLTAWELGATCVKVFPADVHGPAHIAALRAAFPDARLMPTGGVTVDSIADFRRAGADAVGVGGPLFDPGRVAAGDWEWIRSRAARFRAAWNAAAPGLHT